MEIWEVKHASDRKKLTMEEWDALVAEVEEFFQERGLIAKMRTYCRPARWIGDLPAKRNPQQ